MIFNLYLPSIEIYRENCKTAKKGGIHWGKYFTFRVLLASKIKEIQ